jgi:hydroxyethylthiazole kinase-like uncharacterized protein yjeF
MIPICTSQEIKKLDLLAKTHDPQAGFALMQKASRIVFDFLISEILKKQKMSIDSRVIVLAGKGNNGGDGLLAAAYLLEQGYKVDVFLFAKQDELQNEALQALNYLKEFDADAIIAIENLSDIVQLKTFFNNDIEHQEHCFIIDALYGVSFDIQKHNQYLDEIVTIVKQSAIEKTIIAIDCPSGINNDTGHISQNVLQATYTITMGFPKLGLFFFPAKAFVGILLVGDLNYPKDLIEQSLQSHTYFVDTVKIFQVPRALNGSKYDHGCVANIAGSFAMPGAAALSSKAILKAGAGLVYLYSKAFAQRFFDELITKDFNDNSIEEILSNKKIDCISVGCGLGTQEQNAIFSLVQKSTKALILDADAINVFENNLDKLKNHKAQVLITPHYGEYQRLFKDEILAQYSSQQLLESVKSKAQEYKISILLKGAPTIIADPSGEVFILSVGNSGLASAGTGDVLTGLIAGFMAQSSKRQNKVLNNSSLLTQNALLAAFIHGRTAELVTPELTEYSLMASDVLNNVHRAIKYSFN